MSACECGSTDFTVEYQTTARINMSLVSQVSVTYGPINDTGMFSTVTCVHCHAKLDIDNTGVTEDFRLAFIAARYRADAIARDLATVTVRARTRPAAAIPPARPDGWAPPASSTQGSAESGCGTSEALTTEWVNQGRPESAFGTEPRSGDHGV